MIDQWRRAYWLTQRVLQKRRCEHAALGKIVPDEVSSPTAAGGGLVCAHRPSVAAALEDPLNLMVPQADRLAGQKLIEIGELQREVFVSGSAEDPNRIALELACATARFATRSGLRRGLRGHGDPRDEGVRGRLGTGARVTTGLRARGVTRSRPGCRRASLSPDQPRPSHQRAFAPHPGALEQPTSEPATARRIGLEPA